jgi:hypothetical protein
MKTSPPKDEWRFRRQGEGSSARYPAVLRSSPQRLRKLKTTCRAPSASKQCQQITVSAWKMMIAPAWSTATDSNQLCRMTIIYPLHFKATWMSRRFAQTAPEGDELSFGGTHVIFRSRGKGSSTGEIPIDSIARFPAWKVQRGFSLTLSIKRLSRKRPPESYSPSSSVSRNETCSRSGFSMSCHTILCISLQRPTQCSPFLKALIALYGEQTRRYAWMMALWSLDGGMFRGKCVTKFPSQYGQPRKMPRYHGTIVR